jgi:glycosyltransferase involved in cell wall biosynthesis
MNTSKHYFDLQKLPAEYNHFQRIETVYVDNRPVLTGFLKNLCTGRSYLLARFESGCFNTALVQLLRQVDFDIVQMETIYLASYIPVIRANSKARIILRSHNVEHKIWERLAATIRSNFKKWYFKKEAAMLKKFEIQSLGKVDAVVAITDDDLDEFLHCGLQKPAMVAPVGLNIAEYVSTGAVEKLKIGFIGAMDWLPNQEGVLWFIREVWPEVFRILPVAEFHVAGRNIPAWLYKYNGRGVVIRGEVPDAKSFINENLIMVAPLFSGSGLKIKVLEAMAMGKIVAATPIALEGIPIEDGKEGFSFSTAKEFATLSLKISDDLMLRTKMGEAAREFISKNFDNIAISNRVIEFYQRILST